MAEDPKKYLGLRLKGRYLIEDHIGSGLSAHAFRAYDILLQGKVVIKIIKSDIAGIKLDLGEEWKEESRKAMQVRGHPHIASILDLGEEPLVVDSIEERVNFIVTEFIEGQTLREMAASDVLISAPMLFDISQQLLSTLAFLQSKKMSHGDLHAGNIMVSMTGENKPFIKVIDFGMASNTIIPRNREKDIYFALKQLDHLCVKCLAKESEQYRKSVLTGLAGLIKKAQNFIPVGRMQLADLLEGIECLKQDLVSGQSQTGKASLDIEGPRRRVDITRPTPFFGRPNEIEKLYKLMSNSFLSKKGAIVIVSGEAGVGKTRLIDEVLGKISTERKLHLLLYNRCRHEMKLPYSVLFGAMSEFLGEIPGRGNEEKLKLVLGPACPLIKPLSGLMDDFRTFSGTDPDSRPKASSSSNIPHLVTGFLTQAALNTPVVLFLDDVHWADDATIEFLGFLSDRIIDSPIIVVCTVRPEELAMGDKYSKHPIIDLEKKLYNNTSARKIELGGLEREEFDAILSNRYLFVRPGDFTALSDSVSRMAGGNPFYLFEITGLLEDEGVLKHRGDDHWILDGDLREFTVPDSIYSLIQRRVDRLSENEIHTLRSAVLQGDSFNLSLLMQMFTPENEPLSEIIRNLEKRHGLIKRLDSSNFNFSHHQVRSAIIRSIPEDDFKRGHKDIARLLVESSGGNEANIPHHLVAYHLAKAGKNRSAARHYLAVGKRAIESRQYGMALDHLRNASELISADDKNEDLSVNIILNLLEAVKPLGEWKLHEQAIVDLRLIAGATGRNDLECKVMIEECIFLRMISENDKSLAVAEKIIEYAREGSDRETEAIALKEAGTACYLLGKMEAAENYFHEAAKTLEGLSDKSQLARVYNNLGLVYRNTMRHEKMVQYFNMALGLFREIDDSIGQRFPLGNLGLVYFERGEYERAFDCFRALKNSLADQADLMMEAKVDFSMGEIYLEVGLFEEARKACERALETFMTIGNRQGESEVLGTLGAVHLARGDIQISREYFERSIEVKSLIGNAVGMLHSQITLARIANLEGRHEEALSIAKGVLDIAKSKGQRSIELECLTEIMVAKAQMEDPSAALTILGPDEDPGSLISRISSALITFAYKVGELAFQAGDEPTALKYIGLSGSIVEDILASIGNSAWRDAYQKKRERILDTYRRLKPAIQK